jgi:hypothetical protein
MPSSRPAEQYMQDPISYKKQKQAMAQPRGSRFNTLTQEQNSIGKDVEKSDFLYTVGRDIKWCNCCRKYCGRASKI